MTRRDVYTTKSAIIACFLTENIITERSTDKKIRHKNPELPHYPATQDKMELTVTVILYVPTSPEKYPVSKTK